MAAVVEHRDGEIERLQTIIKQLQRTQFGRRSERLDADQFALGLEDLDSDIGRAEASGPQGAVEIADRRPRRKALADHLPREEVLIDVANDACPCCGGVLHSIGESVSEMLDWVPAQLRVLRITRPKYACRTCDTVAQAPAPERPIAGSLATPALLAQVLVSKYCDHTPLYRQAQIFARHGVELERSTLAGWVGGACWWLEALDDRLRKDVFASIICSPTTRQSRSSIRAVDEPRPGGFGSMRVTSGRWGGTAPPAAVYIFAPERKAERPASHLEYFKGALHVHGYAGFERLTTRGDVVLAACWAHIRAQVLRGCADHGYAVGAEALRRIAGLYAVEERSARSVVGASAGRTTDARQADRRRSADLAGTTPPASRGRGKLAKAMRTRHIGFPTLPRQHSLACHSPL